MIKNIGILITLGLLSAFTWFLDYSYTFRYSENIFLTSLFITISYAVFRLLLLYIPQKYLERKKRYYYNKILSILYFLSIVVIILNVWVQNIQALFVAYGVVGAGIAIALQDVFKSFAGGIFILFSSPYRVGDRIEISGKTGDVIDIGLFHTTLYELRQWVGGDQATGRIVTLPNSLVLNAIVNNFTRDNSFIWDELSIPITYDSNWDKVEKIMKKITDDRTVEVQKQAKKEIQSLFGKYYLDKRELNPTVYNNATENYLVYSVRYIAPARERRKYNNEIGSKILEQFKKEKDIKIASPRLRTIKPEENI